MQNVEFFLTQATYKVIDGRPIIHLFGRTKDNKQICVIDKNFRPYFYIKPKNDIDGLKKVLKGLSIDVKGVDYKIEEISNVTLPLHGKDVELLKVFVNIPAAVPHIKKEVWAWDAVDRCYEFDIRFSYKYLMEKALTPLRLVKAQGVFTKELQYKVPVLDAKTVEQSSQEVLEKPKVLAIDIETYNPEGKTIDMERFPILMIALYGEDFHHVITYKTFQIKEDNLRSQTHFEADEKSMLEKTAKLITEYAPDIITGYNSDGFDFPYIKKRVKKTKAVFDVGLDGSSIITRGTTNTNSSIMGIAHVDIFRFIRRVMSLSMRTVRYNLDSVAQELLGKSKIEVDMDRLHVAWDEQIDNELEDFAKYNLRDSDLTWQLVEHAYPLMTHVTKIVGQSVENVSRMSFSQLVEWYIMKKATKRGHLIPSRPSFAAAESRSKERVEGAFVFKPTPGLYNNLAVFDFRSLYPTILVSHNISIDTLNLKDCKIKNKAPIDGQDVVFCADKEGFLAAIMKELIIARKKIKEDIKTQGKTPQLYAHSQAIKYMCNSFYGYLGFAQSRWYSIESAAAITAWGRHYIHQVIAKAKDFGFSVAYGDTDSVFLKMEDKTKEDALSFVEEVNSTLPEFMELEIQGFYPSALFVATKGGSGGAKKRYALLDEDDFVKIVGFETVRRNISPIAKEVQKNVLEILLKEKDDEKARSYVKDVITDLRNHKIPKEQVIIFTQLTREIHEYTAIGPHVAAAKLMVERGDKVTARTYIHYIVCKGTGRIRDKVKLPDEVTNNDYDSDYYINNQVLPAVERIFDALGTSADDLKNNQSSLGKFF